MNALFIIRDSPRFKISLLKDTLEIQKDNNALNDKTYVYSDLKSIYINKEIDSIIHILLNLILPIKKSNEKILVIETTGVTDKIYLRNCNLKELKRCVQVINQRIVTHSSENDLEN